MINIKKCDSEAAATWERESAGKKPIVYCPKCEMPLLGVSAAHEIQADGTVTDELVCCYAPCDFKGQVKLQDWDGGFMERIEVTPLSDELKKELNRMKNGERE